MIEPGSDKPTQAVTNRSETATKWLLEPALIVTAVTAAFYAAGHLVYLRDAARLGIPGHLLPEMSTESKILIGSFNLVIISLFLMLIISISLFVAHFFDKNYIKNIYEKIMNRIEKHPMFYRVLGGLALIVVTVLSVMWLPSGKDWPYSDTQLPKVVKIDVAATVPKFDESNLRYLTRRDGWVVLKRLG